MFDPHGQSGTVNERGSIVRRLSALAGTSAGTQRLRPQRGPLPAAGRDLASGIPGALSGWPVSAAGTVPRVISLSW
jgi:hypothetical protein